MTIQGVTAHRMTFPNTRLFAKRVAVFGAIVANKISSDYLQAQMAPEEPEEEFVPNTGYYL